MPAQQVDWTFGPAPAADEPAPLSPTPRRPRPTPQALLRLSRRTWLLLGALVVLAIALTVALPVVQNVRDAQALEQVVARQERARLAGDWAGLRATYADDSLGWAVTHVARLQNGWLPTPISLPGLRSDGQPGRVARFQVLGQQLARADVTRGFVLADGTRVSFAMPQFYQFAQGAWRQVAPPVVPRDQAQHFHGARVDVTYYPDDADLAPVLASELDDLLSRACVDWACPPELRVAVIFDPGDPASAASRVPFDNLLGSLTLQTILGRPTAYPAQSVSLASRLTGGYPADAAATEAMRRAAGVRVLMSVAQQLAPSTLLHGENAYLDALIAREAARLGVDEAGLSQFAIADPLYQPADLWSVPLLHLTSDGALPEALVILNQVLPQGDLAAEQRLMHGFGTASGVQDWLVSGLGLSGAEARQRLSQALNPPFPQLTKPAPGGDFAPDFALSCPAGPMLGTLTGQARTLLAGDVPGSSVDAWSPDGQRLALSVSGRLSVVDVTSRAGQFVPMASVEEGIPPAWASNTLLVYPAAVPGQGPTDPSGNSGLVYFEMGVSHSAKQLPNFDSWLPSPDRAWAVAQGDVYSAEPTLAVLPAFNGQPIFTARYGYNPDWSADSQHLVFALRDTELSSLVIFDMTNRDKRTIFQGGGPSEPTAPTAPTYLTAAWAPGGDRLAMTSLSDTGTGYAGWAATLAPDGSGFQLLPPARAGLSPDTLGYSADGQLLAVGLFDASGKTGVALYSPAGALLRWLPGYQVAAWSPAGHILALTNMDGVSLLREPGDANAAPQIIGPPGCTGLAWKP